MDHTEPKMDRSPIADASAAAEPREGRSARLKAGTADLHARLDRRIMELRPFESRDRYGRFLRAQYHFQTAVETACHDQPGAAALVPDIAERRRLSLIGQDLRDLGIPLPAADPAAPAVSGDAERLGWLYVAEGSTLGAAFLLVEARKLGFDETFGARHLGAHPEGRGLHWKRFKQALDAAALGPEGEERAVAAAAAAFGFVAAVVEAEFA